MLRIQLDPETKEDEKVKIKEELISIIRKVFTDYNCREPEVEVIFAEPLKNINSGKLSRVICEIKEV